MNVTLAAHVGSPVYVPAAPLPVQLPAHMLGQVAGNGPHTQVPDSRVGSPDGLSESSAYYNMAVRATWK